MRTFINFTANGQVSKLLAFLIRCIYFILFSQILFIPQGHTPVDIYHCISKTTVAYPIVQTIIITYHIR